MRSASWPARGPAGGRGGDGGGGARVRARALAAAPGYVREEVARLLPGLDGDNGPVPVKGGGEWSRQRLFAGVAELLAAVAGQSSGGGVGGGGVHWAGG